MYKYRIYIICAPTCSRGLYVVGGDACDGVAGPVGGREESQSRLARNHLYTYK